MDIGTLFMKWVEVHASIVCNQVRPFYAEQYTQYGPGFVVFRFSSVEALARHERATQVSFSPMPEKKLGVHEMLVNCQGEKWIPMMGIVRLPDGTTVVAANALACDAITSEEAQRIAGEGKAIGRSNFIVFG